MALALAAGAPAVARADAVIAAAGDIACDPLDASFNGGFGTSTRCRQKYTSNLLLASGYDAVLALGDLQYNAGSLANFQRAYDPTWGRVKAITRPVIGNHEGNTATTGAGYCTYWGAAAHCNAANRQGNAAFYSFDIGGWHVVVLNSNCTAAGGCGVGSPQYTWLQNDLAAHPATCTLGVWHHPRFSSGLDGSNTFMQPIWKLLYDAGADLVLVAHSHDYERFAPMDGNGALNRTNGMREIVVGTGGVFFTGFSSTAPNSELRNNRSYGILKLTLHAASYDWQFIPESGGLFDSGSGPCRGAAPPSPPPPSPPPPSPPPPPPPPPGNTQTFRADADSSVVSGAPNSNLGTATTLLSTSGAFTAESYLRFTVSGVGGGTVTSAKLRLFVPSDATVDGPGVYACSDPACATWSETGITWNNRPPRASTATADVGAIARGTTAEWDVTPLVAGNSAVTLVVGPAPTTDSVSFSSHEASANQPQLVVTTS